MFEVVVSLGKRMTTAVEHVLDRQRVQVIKEGQRIEKR